MQEELRYLAEQNTISVALPSSTELFFHNKPGFMIFGSISIQGSLDGKNAIITIREGRPPGIKNIFSSTIATLASFNASAGQIDNVPIVVQLNDAIKQYTVSWAPRTWLYFRAVQLYLAMPPPTLDTVTLATVSYVFAAWVSY